MNTPPKEQLGFAELAKMSRDGGEDVVTRSLLLALVSLGVNELWSVGEPSQPFHRALARIHWHAQIMAKRGAQFGISSDQCLVYRAFVRATRPSPITGAFGGFWGLVGCHTFSLELSRDRSRNGWWGIGMRREFAKDYLTRSYEPDYVVLLMRYAQVFVRFLDRRP